jgi:hypothetical protein
MEAEMNRGNSRMMFAVMAAVLERGMGGLFQVGGKSLARDKVAFRNGMPVKTASSPNGGKRRTVAQAKRAARKRVNRLRAKGRHA